MSAEPEGPHHRALRVEISPRVVAWSLGAIAGVWLLTLLWQIVVVVVVALMLVGMLNPFVARLERRGWKRTRAIAAVFTALSVCVVAFAALTIPRFFSQLSDLIDRFPDIQQKLVAQLQGSKLLAPLAKTVRDARATELLAEVARLGFAYSSRILEWAAYAVTSLFLALYFMVDRDRMRGSLFALVPRSFHVRTSRILVNLETIVGGYLRGQLITSALMSVLTLIVLSIARVPNALVLSLFAGAADVLPYVGAVLACGPAFLAALERGTTVALVVLTILLAYQEIESRFIVPRVYGKVLRLPSAAILLSLLVGGRLFGILGALLALPIAAGLRMIAAELRVELPGDGLRNSAIRREDEREEMLFERRAAGASAGEAAAVAVEIAQARIERDASDRQ